MTLAGWIIVVLVVAGLLVATRHPLPQRPGRHRRAGRAELGTPDGPQGRRRR